MEHKDVDMNAIFAWDMTPREIEVYKLTVLYEQEFKRVFGEEADGQAYRRNSIPKRTDPRKSNLFRHCWKLYRETQGLLDPHEYRNYFLANLTILKLNHGFVGPNAMCGDKAWVRYKFWKRKFDQKMAEKHDMTPPPTVSSTNPKIIAQIDTTKKFLFEKCDGQPTLEKIKGLIATGMFKFWVATGKVSSFYVALSPFVAKAVDVEKLAKECAFSLGLMREKTTKEIDNYFQSEFQHEFKTGS